MSKDTALREFAEKIVPVIINASVLCNTEEIIEAFTGGLTALISEHYVSKEKVGYPKEFVEWIGDDCSPCYLEREEDGYGKWVVFKRGSMEHEAEFDTLDELFNYWKENEQ